MSPQLDPFIIYTVKLAMDFKSVEEEPSTPIPTRSSRPIFDKTTDYENEKTSAQLQQDNFTNPMFPDTMARIMAIKPFSLKPGEKAPKLKRDNILSLLYHAGKYITNK